MNLPDMVDRAIDLLRTHEPAEGYYLAFSGGKDSCAIKRLAQLSGVKFDAFYNNTTIDPPELVRFIKKEHPDVKWNNPAMPMMTRVATAPKVPPTRVARWCCEEYKETTGSDRVRIFGVRAAESKARKRRWSEVAGFDGALIICPIVHWSDEKLWGFIREYGVAYCSLYDEGYSRLGCVGCPLGSRKNQDREFLRWPRYRDNWKKAIIQNWEKWKDIPRQRDGLPRFQSKFKSGEDFWNWWITAKAPDYMRGDCQMQNIWTNEDVSDAGPEALVEKANESNPTP